MNDRERQHGGVEGAEVPERDVNPYQAQADALAAAIAQARAALEGPGIKIEKARPGWQPPRQRKPTESYRRRQITKVRSGEIPLPPGVDRNVEADRMARELDRNVLLEEFIETLESIWRVLKANIDAARGKNFGAALTVFHKAKTFVADNPADPLAPLVTQMVKQMDHALRTGQERGKGKKNGGRGRRKGK